jgi:hypothetical protein
MFSGLLDGSFGLISPLVLHTAGIAKLLRHEVIGAIGNVWVNGRSGMVIKVNHGAADWGDSTVALKEHHHFLVVCQIKFDR